jgi:hypothetical protein
MRINSKVEFYRLWEEGALGNRTKIFHTLEDAMNSGAVSIGFREMRAGGGTWEGGPRDEAPERYARWVKAGRKFIMDDMVPNHKSTMQGELCYTCEEGLTGFLAVGYALPPMRRSIAAGMHKTYRRVQVRLLLERYMDPASRDDIDMLFERYPDAAIEFSCFDVNVGNIPGRNTIIWEVRNY